MNSNSLYTCDNLFLLNGMNSQSVDLIYLDPPFNSKRSYSAPVGSKSAGASFKDMWTWDDVNVSYLEKLYSEHTEIADYIEVIGHIHSKAMMAYIAYMTQRLIEMHRILKDTGSIYLHIDPTASHYLKIIMDMIFGKNNFRNEIIWHYYNGSNRSHRNFGRKHDIILFYAVNKKKHVYNYDAMREPYAEGSTYAKGVTYGTKGFMKGNENGKLLHDVWRMPSINNMAKERLGYPTQKPLALLDRIIKASSNENDVVFDPFCGCATAMVSAQRLNRNWIGCDIEEKAVEILVYRLTDDAGLFTDFVHTFTPPTRTDIEIIPPSIPIKDRLYAEQKGTCCGCLNTFDKRNLEIDHIIPRSKGGGDYYENYQLLCGACNRVKGDRPMEYLLAKVKKIRETKQAISYT